MTNKKLIEEVGKLGYALFDINDDLKTNKIIRDVVLSNDLRLWEGFPVILANANEKKQFDFKKVKSLFKDNNEYKKFIKLLLISLSLYQVSNNKFYWTENILDNLKEGEKKQLNNLINKFKHQIEFNINNNKLSPERIWNIFNNYYVQQEKEIKNISNNYSELSLEYSLSQLFSAKQKEILLKRVKGKKLTKTEREYFYRVVKKKALAITNPDLQKIAEQAIK